MDLKAGMRLFAQNSSCEVIVVRSTPTTDALSCGGLAMVTATPGAAGAPAVPAPDGPAIELGERYVDADELVEILCTKAGAGPLALGARVLSMKAPKPLPASD
jgi:hypothetical protein